MPPVRRRGPKQKVDDKGKAPTLIGSLSIPASRYALQRLLKTPGGLGNPYPGRTRWHDLFDYLCDEFAHGRFATLQFRTRKRAWMQAVLHVNELLDVADLVGDPAGRVRQFDRRLARANLDERLSSRTQQRPKVNGDLPGGLAGEHGRRRTQAAG